MLARPRFRCRTLSLLAVLTLVLSFAPASARAQWYPYPSYRYAPPDSSVRVLAAPKQAAVYVDGYFAGLVDNFDGYFQRLRVTPGEHEITLFLQGYRTVRQKVYLQVNATFKLEVAMEPLPPGETSEPVPPPVAPATAGPGAQAPVPPAAAPPPPREAPPAPPLPPPPAEAGAEPATFGTLAFRIQPRETTVVIDGARRPGPQWDEVMLVQLPEGSHRVEIEKSGYETYSRELSVRRGETTTLEIKLERKHTPEPRSSVHYAP